MQYFTLQASTLRDAITKMKKQYGENARLLTHRGIKVGGVLGFFARQGIEITGYISDNVSKRLVTQEEKRKIIEAAQKEQTLTKILKEIQTLKQSMNQREIPVEEENPAIEKITEILELNDSNYGLDILE